MGGQPEIAVLSHGRQETCLSGLSQERREQGQTLSTDSFLLEQHQAMGEETFN